MKAILFSLIVVLLVSCALNKKDNPFVGKWKLIFQEQNEKVTLTIDFFDDYTFTTQGFDEPVHIIVHGNYKVSNDTFQILDKQYLPVQICSFTDTGLYSFVKKNDTLRFKAIFDRCEKRRFVLTSGLNKMK